MNRFKGLYLVERVPEELWKEVHNILKEVVTKTTSKKKKCKKAKLLSEEALQIAAKRRDAKGKGEMESYNHLNAEFQRIARRDKKAFLRDQCKDIEENKRMGKTRDLFKKIRHTEGTFGEGNGTPLQYSCLENPMDGGAWWSAVHGVAKSQTQLSDFTFTFHFHALEKEMATHSSVLAWRIPGTGELGGLPSMGSHRVGHD